MTVDIQKLFQELRRRCEPEDVFSVREIASEMNINYDFIVKCAKENAELNEVLQQCRDTCCIHAMDAGLNRRIPTRKAHRYLAENDDEFAAEFGHEEFFDDEK